MNPTINIDECLQIGTLLKSSINTYQIIDILGQGGCGITYLAEAKKVINGNTDDQNRVAIKEFFIRRTSITYCARKGTMVECTEKKTVVNSYRNNFKKEIDRILSIPHHNVVKTFDKFEANQTDYYVMEYGAGGSLGEFKYPMPEEDAIKIIKAVAGVISTLHQRNTLHLDIKPDNIVLRQNGEPMVIDFGISKKFNMDGRLTTITEQTPHSQGYSPEEQCSGGGINSFTPQTDIYALGATLYRLVTAIEPLPAQTIRELGFPTFPDTISEKTKNIIKYAMQPNISRRPKDVAVFANALSSGNVPPYVTNVQSVMPQNNGGTIIERGTPTNYAPQQTVIQRPNINVTTSTTASNANKNNNTRSILIGAAIVVFGVIGYKYVDSNKAQDALQQDSIGNVIATDNIEETESTNTSSQSNQVSQSQTTAPKTDQVSNTSRAVTVVEQPSQETPEQTAPPVQAAPTQAAPMQTAAPASEMSADELLSKGISANKKFRYEDAANYLTKAANKGSISAMYLLADLYYNGNGVNKSYPTAKKYFTQAANAGYVEAQYMIGVMYRNGQGGDKNVEQAKVWLQKAASQGHSKAKRMLNNL